MMFDRSQPQKQTAEGAGLSRGDGKCLTIRHIMQKAKNMLEKYKYYQSAVMGE